MLETGHFHNNDTYFFCNPREPLKGSLQSVEYPRPCLGKAGGWYARPLYHLHTLRTLGAKLPGWTLCTGLWITFVLPVTVPVCCAVLQYLIFRTDNTVIIFVIRMSGPRQKDFYLFSNLKWRFLLRLSALCMYPGRSRQGKTAHKAAVWHACLVLGVRSMAYLDEHYHPRGSGIQQHWNQQN